MQTQARSSLAAQRPRRNLLRTTTLVAGLAAAAGTLLSSRTADAFEYLPGQEAAFAIQGVFGACSVISSVGNALNIVNKNAQRGWMYSGFICGFINTAASPIIMIYGRDPSPEFGLGAGAAHGVLGITNLALAIYNGVLWHRAQVAGTEPPKVTLAPLLTRDSYGGTVVGLSLSSLRF